MPAKKPYKVDIDVVPYLSIMAIVLKLICLILIVMVMRIAVNPDALRIIRYTQLYQPQEEVQTQTEGAQGSEKQLTREPMYIDCHPDMVEIQPSGLVIPARELKERNGDFESILHNLETNRQSQMAIVIARPSSAPVYRYVRRQLAARKLPVGYDVLESDVIIDWPGAMSNMQVRLKDLEETQANKSKQ